MKIVLSISLSFAIYCLAQAQQISSEAITQSEAHRQMSDAWKAIEPHLFTSKSVAIPTAGSVMVSGTPITFKPAIVIRSSEGVIVHLTKLQKADREELATFRKPPSKITVEGPILSIDTEKRFVVIEAVSSHFSP